jgi:hypothetical protein
MRAELPRRLFVRYSLRVEKRGRRKSAGCVFFCPKTQERTRASVVPRSLKNPLRYLRRTTACARMPEPMSKAAAGKTIAGSIPPLGGTSGAVVSPPRAVVCAKPVGTRISIATRAAVISKSNLFIEFPLLCLRFSLYGLHIELCIEGSFLYSTYF